MATEASERRYEDEWPKPMFFCTGCDEQTDSDPCERCFDPNAEHLPHVHRWKVVPEDWCRQDQTQRIREFAKRYGAGRPNSRREFMASFIDALDREFSEPDA